MRPAFLGQVQIARGLGQYSWNTYAQPFQNYPAGGGFSTSYGPVEGAPQPVAQAAQAASPAGGTFDCTDGSSFKNGVSAAEAAALRKQGWICTPSPRPGGALPEFPDVTAYGSTGGMPLPSDFSGMMGRRPSMSGRIPTVPIGRFY